MANSRPAVLFGIDGTLVDSNYLHVHAWQRAFAEVGLPVQAWHIHRSIGMDGATLVDELSQGAPGMCRNGSGLHRYYQAGAAADHAAGARGCCGRWPSATCRWSWPPRRRKTNSRCCVPRSTAMTSCRLSPPRRMWSRPNRNPASSRWRWPRPALECRARRLRRRRGGCRGQRSGRVAVHRRAVRRGVAMPSSKKPVPQRFSMMPRISANTSTTPSSPRCADRSPAAFHAAGNG